MGRKKIQKASKEDKAEEDHQSDQQAEPEDVQEPEPPKDQDHQQNTKAGHKKRGPKPKQAQKTQKKEKSAIKNSGEEQLFTRDFNQRIQNFKGFYQQYLALKANSNNLDTNSQLNKINSEVRKKIQKACFQVIKQNINDAQKWIEKQQETIIQQISNVEKVEQDTRKALEATGTFSKSQIESQIQGIRKKKVSLQQSLNRFEQTKNKAAQLYKNQNSMDQQ